MTLAEFRKLTAHLPGDLEFCCAGGEIRILWHHETTVSIDDGLDFELPWDASILFCDGDESGLLYELQGGVPE